MVRTFFSLFFGVLLADSSSFFGYFDFDFDSGSFYFFAFVLPFLNLYPTINNEMHLGADGG